MSNLSVFGFDGQEIRFVDGKPVGNDVASVLGYADPAKTVSTKVKDKNRSVTKMVTVDGKLREVTVLEEAGIYQLIFGSKLPSAEKFQDWVFEEVLPSIRKTGQYSSPDLILNQGWLTRNIEYKKKTKIPYDYFSIFGELTCGLISDFETAGYQLPTSSHIDISVGLCWSNHIKAKIGDAKVNSLRKLYDHYYPDGRVVKSHIYHNSLLPDFREWMELLYKKEPLNKYLKKNDPRALTYLSEFLQLALLPG
jgi:prophage antirepressor-like protein